MELMYAIMHNLVKLDFELKIAGKLPRSMQLQRKQARADIVTPFFYSHTDHYFSYSLSFFWLHFL